MAAFSFYQHHPFLLESVFLPNTPLKMSAFSEEPNTTVISQFYYPPEYLQQISVDLFSHESIRLENCAEVIGLNSNNESSDQEQTNKICTDSSSVNVDSASCFYNKTENENGDYDQQVTQKKVVITMDNNKKKRKTRDHDHKSSMSTTSVQSKDAREVKGKRQKRRNGRKEDVDDEGNKVKSDKKGVNDEEAPTGYIRVRARRGQATDSHSLAERVRREKISERMKMLQGLVPGCDKVTGKALMLDEIINYVQSLQNQVEFLSMKLASMNPMFYDFGMELDVFMGTPERLSSYVSPWPNVQKCNPAQPSVFSDAPKVGLTAPDHSYPLFDTTPSLVFQQGQKSIIPPQENGQLIWDVDEHRQRLVNQSSFNNFMVFPLI